MKSERRHELETNQLADWAGNKIQSIAPYSVFIVVGLLLLVALAVGAAVYSSFAAARRGDAWEAYFRAVDEQDPAMLKESADEYAGSDAAGWALVKAGNQVYGEGMGDMFGDKKQALEKLASAEAYFKDALDNAGRDQARRQQAKLGLAQVLEEQGKVDEALNYYKDLANVTGPLGDQAKAAVAELSDKNSPRFAWAKYHIDNDPKPAGTGVNPFEGMGNPGGGLNLPGTGGAGSADPFGDLGLPGTGSTTAGGTDTGIGADTGTDSGTVPGTGTGGVLDGIGVVPEGGTTPSEGGTETGGEFKPPTTDDTPGVNPDSGGEFMPPSTEDTPSAGEPDTGTPTEPAEPTEPTAPAEPAPAEPVPAESAEAEPGTGEELPAETATP